MTTSKFYKDLTINEKINTKSRGFWRLSNPQGFILTMIDNADSFSREDYASYMRHHLCMAKDYQSPKF